MTTRNLIPALALLLSATAWSAGADRYPIRQIDRPLVLPAKMWQERLIQNSVLELNDGGMEMETEGLQGFWPALPSYAFTDRWMWVAIPAPYFRYLLIGNTSDSAQGRVARGLSLALDGGLTGFGYSSREGSNIIGTLSLIAKRPLSSRAWGEGQLGLISRWDSEGEGVKYLSGSAGLGIQASDRIYFKPAYGLFVPVSENSLSLLFEDESNVLQYGTLEAGVNFTPNLSLGFQISLLAGAHLWLNPGANLAFQW